MLCSRSFISTHKTNSIREMIINEKYLQDIDDDDDDDGLSTQPLSSRVMSDAKFDHYVRIAYSDMFNTQPMSTKRKDDELTYGTFTEIYDELDDFMDSMISVTDYHIRITAVIDEKGISWWLSQTMPPNYDSDTDYGKMGAFDPINESCIHNLTIEVGYDCKRMSFEQFLKIIFEIRKQFKQMNIRSYSSMGLLP